jgi:putative SOS response-associated peptidase YedK
MPQRKEYESSAEKQRAYRERKRAELEEQQIEEVVPIEVEVLPAGRTPTISEEEYVREAMELARLHQQQTSPDARDSTVELEMRVARAEAYAHWRYRGFVAGEIASL